MVKLVGAAVPPDQTGGVTGVNTVACMTGGAFGARLATPAPVLAARRRQLASSPLPRWSDRDRRGGGRLAGAPAPARRGCSRDP
jgi:hypothetical protein